MMTIVERGRRAAASPLDRFLVVRGARGSPPGVEVLKAQREIARVAIYFSIGATDNSPAFHTVFSKRALVEFSAWPRIADLPSADFVTGLHIECQRPQHRPHDDCARSDAHARYRRKFPLIIASIKDFNIIHVKILSSHQVRARYDSPLLSTTFDFSFFHEISRGAEIFVLLFCRKEQRACTSAELLSGASSIAAERKAARAPRRPKRLTVCGQY